MKNKNLLADSPSYFEQNDVYEIFSQAEDHPGKIFEYLKKIVRKKHVLDIGCGTGKYVQLLAPYAGYITGIDASGDQIRLAEEKNGSQHNVRLLTGDASSINLAKNSLDVVLGCRFLSTVTNEKKQNSIIKKLEESLKTGGQIFLVENDISGEFETIREKHKLKMNPTVQYHNRLLSKGFTIARRIKTYFLFASLAEAKRVFAAIWGSKKGNNVHSKKIAHDVVIFEYMKS